MGRVLDCVFFYQNCADLRATRKSFACEHSHIVFHIRSKASCPLGLVVNDIYSIPKQYKRSSTCKSSGGNVILTKQITIFNFFVYKHYLKSEIVSDLINRFL